ncbi:hypothetical protein [Nocardia colli]|uniref:hypothetical protein n=1 Tax=Nocardia colli TaxID=2545717 RepID=UPI00168CB98A|nr:hypothetical protein [Nocardia colli]
MAMIWWSVRVRIALRWQAWVVGLIERWLRVVRVDARLLVTAGITGLRGGFSL